MRSVSVGAAMIVRNEERYLEACLRSIRDAVDEIVVVDTGSADRTVEIARRFDSVIAHHPWNGHFAEARNTALDRIASEWVLYIDADERLRLPGETALADHLGDSRHVAQYVLFQPISGFTPYHEIRLFRSMPEIRFESPIHETVHPAIRRLQERDNLIVSPCDVRIDHEGYDGDITHKDHRNIPLLHAAIADYPERVFLRLNLGESLQRLGRADEAAEQFRAAIALSRHHPDAKQRTDGANAWMHLVRMETGNDPGQAFALAETARSLYPDHKAIALAWAGAAFANGMGDAVAPLLEDLLMIDAERFCDPLVAYDKRIFGEWAADLLGAVHARAGRFDEAAKCYTRAAESVFDAEPYRRKAQAFAALANGGSKNDPTG